MKNVLIRVDGNNRIGIGHITREISIARELLKENYSVTFLIKDSKETIVLLRDFKIDFIDISDTEDEIASIIEHVKSLTSQANYQVELLIIDLLEEFYDQDYLDALRSYCRKLIVLSDHSYPLYYKDVDVIFAFSPNQKSDSYKDFTETRYYTGLKYVALNKEFQNLKKKQINPTVKRLLLTFGGSDPKNFSYEVLKLLNRQGLAIEIVLIIGPGYTQDRFEKLSEFETDKIWIERNITNMVEIFESVDMCICSAGNTLIELLTSGMPCIVLPQTVRENEHATAIEQEGFIINMGLRFEDYELTNKIFDLKENFNKRKLLSENAQNYFDGKGLDRIMDVILNL